MAKLLFSLNKEIKRINLSGILSSSESVGLESAFHVLEISDSDYNNFVSYNKTFTVNADNSLNWIDIPAPEDENGDPKTLDQTEYEAQIRWFKQEMNIYKECHWNESKKDKIELFLSELDLIDVSSISFPFTGTIEKDICDRCANSMHPLSLATHINT